jgi:hypothetical protein
MLSSIVFMVRIIDMLTLLLFCSLLSSLAEECAVSHSPTCQSSDGGARSVIVADYAPNKQNEDDEQEEVNDADLILHMQVRLSVDLPAADASKPQHVATAHTNGPQGSSLESKIAPKEVHQVQQHRTAGEATESAAVVPGQHPLLDLQSGSNVHTDSEAAQPALAHGTAMSTSTYVSLGLTIGALLTIGFFLFDRYVLLRFKQKRAQSHAEQRAAAKSKMNAFIMDNFMPLNFSSNSEAKKQGVLTLLEKVSDVKEMTLEALPVNVEVPMEQEEKICEKDIEKDIAMPELYPGMPREDEEEPESETNLGNDSYVDSHQADAKIPCHQAYKSQLDAITPAKEYCDAI